MHIVRHHRMLLIMLASFTGLAQADTISVRSPDGRNVVSIDSDRLSYAVQRDGKALITSSPLGLQLDAGALKAGARLTGRAETSVRDTYDIVLGKARNAPDHYQQTILSFEASDQKKFNMKFQIVVRAYDSGVALRYVVPVQAGLDTLTVRSEDTQFNFAKDYDCWGANIGRFDTSFEAEYDRIKASSIRNFHNYMAPLVCKTGNGQATFAIAESDVSDYPGFFLSGRGDAGLGVMVTLPPRFDNDRHFRSRKTVAARVSMKERQHDWQSPWRVIMFGDTPGALAASSLIPTLAAPSRISDTSWIKPGKTAWDWWNDWAVNVPNAGVNTATYKAYVDFAQQMKLDGITIDEGWSVGSDIEPNPQADITRAKPELDLPALLQYAKARNVGVWLWVQWHQLDRQMEDAFAQYAAWGIRGVKVDFMNRNDQEMVDWYHKVLSSAARHKLMVNLHGAYPPDGLNRTWPNYITQEGVLGAENNKWSARITASHNVTLPFTRMILGPMDYTPGGFRNTNRAGFTARNHEPMVLTTRGQALAMYVVYDSPLQMVADAPAAYRSTDGARWADGAQFIQDVPTTWDETRILAGDIGQYIVSARRKGDTWYLGAMTNESGRTLKLPLAFLGAGRYHAQVLEDGASPTALRQSAHKVDAARSLTLTLAPSGGAVAILRPQSE